MKLKVAVGAAILFGVLATGLFVENMQLRVQIVTQQKEDHKQQTVLKKGLQEIFSGDTSAGHL